MKRLLGMVLAICMVVSLLPAGIAQAAGGTTVYLLPESFKENLGTWSQDKYFDSYDGKILFGLSNGNVNAAKPAFVDLNLTEDGDYFVWARSRDFDTNPGTRTFQIQLGDTKFDTKIGAHGQPSWQWQLAGKATVKKGITRLTLIDNTAQFPRVDVLCITNDSGYQPPNDAAAIKKELDQYLYAPSGGSTAEPTVQPSARPTAEPGKSREKNGYFAFFGIDAFQDNLGSWTIESRTWDGKPEDNSLFGECIRGLTDHNISGAQDAFVTFQVPMDGEYTVWVHARDFESSPGTRVFKAKVDDQMLPQQLGTNGKNTWAWELAGTIMLQEGQSTISMVDTNGYMARFDAVCITSDGEYIPPQIDARAEFDQYEYKGQMIAEGDVTGGLSPEDAGPRPDTEIAVKLNGKWLEFDVQPILLNDRTMVPFRAIFEALGCGVDWNNASQTAIGERNGTRVELPIGDPNARINGQVVELDQEAVLIDDRTLVPLRFVSQSFGGLVKWEEDTQTVTITAKIPKAAFFLRPESFTGLGSWILEANSAGSFNTTSLRGFAAPTKEDGTELRYEEKMKLVSPATASINVAQEGQYKIWVHSKDYQTNQPGTRHFKVGVDGQLLAPAFGTHGEEGFRWTEGGIVTFTKGKHEIQLIDDSAFYARCDGILITSDLELNPPDDYASVTKIAMPIDKTIVDPSFPTWAKSVENPREVAVLQNGELKITFYEVDGREGRFIKKKTEVGGIAVEDLEDDFGYLLIRALSSEKSGYDKEFTVYKQQYEVDGEPRSALTSDIYKAGAPNWLIPRRLEVLGDNQVKLYFDSPYADVAATWELNSQEQEPKVSVDMTAKEPGCYSIGVYNGPAVEDEDYEFALLPYRIQSKRVPQERYLITEMFAFTPMAAVTLPSQNSVTSGAVTYGLVVEPSWIPARWVYRDNAKFGLALRNQDGKIQPSAFAPLFGSEECSFEQGQSYNFQYRPTYTKEDWYANYLHVAGDLFEVTDYRSNYYSNLNEAIFNARDLMLDDDLGGWDPKAMAHYNMEGRNITSIANPVEAVQAYLLTEDPEILEKRTVPTIANLLSRNNIHFYYGGSLEGGGDFFSKIKGPYPLGEPTSAFKTDVLGGIYEMSQGRMPYLLKYGEQIGENNQKNISYGATASFVNDVAMYKYTGDKKYLDNAVAVADEYLEKVVYAPQTAYVDFSSFIFINQYPNLASLLDIYEATGDQKYLDAAVETGKWLTTCLWVPGLDSGRAQQDLTITPEEITSINLEKGGFSWWHGDYKWRLGTPKGSDGSDQDFSTLKTETVPQWVPSRVGLGLEQTSTFGTSKNIYMSSWAGDLMRLSALSGEEYFETCARNAMVGRFANYPGYYIGRNLTIQMKPDYPLEGPDFTSIFYHHIPPFIAQMEEFLISQAFAWSEQNIDFPSTRQYGYAYFNSNQYGAAPGKVYDQEGMWPWLDRGIVESDSVQIDWVAAKKEGVLALALMNEAKEETTATYALGDKVPGGSSYTGTAAVYEADGTKSEVQVENGTFRLSIPAASMKTVVMNLPGIKAPAFAQAYQFSTELGGTMADHGNGKGYVIQLAPENYFAYVYATDLPDKVQKATLRYQIGGGAEQTAEVDSYPFEFIVKVDDAAKEFNYVLELTGIDGKVQKSAKMSLQPLK